MKVSLVHVASIVCFASVGCRLTENAVRTTIVEPLQYSRNAYEKVAHHEFTDLAQAALDREISVRRAEVDDYTCVPFTVDYQLGFIDGFVDYLEGGGNGQPPMLPPRRYWKATYQSCEGHEAAGQWFAGYRHGANVASASSCRSLVTVPLSDTIVTDTRPYPYGRYGAQPPRKPDADSHEAQAADRVADARKGRPAQDPTLNRRATVEPPHADLESLKSSGPLSTTRAATLVE